jgi:carboxyl-terminal processing protease
VYGGGGIRPDVIVRADTTGYSEYWSRLVRGGQILEFTQHYLDGNREKLAAKYADVERYISDFDARELLPQLADYAAGHGVERDEEGLKTSREWLASQLKALIAQRLWDTTAYFRVSHRSFDETFECATEMMSRWRALPQTTGEFVSDELVRTLAGTAVETGAEVKPVN